MPGRSRDSSGGPALPLQRGVTRCIGGSILLIVIGAILRDAVSDTDEEIGARMVGRILIVGGTIGLVVSLIHEVLWRDRAVAGDVIADR